MLITKPTTILKGVEYTLQLNKTDLAALFSDDVFSVPSNWATCVLRYKNAIGQKADVEFNLNEATPTGKLKVPTVVNSDMPFHKIFLFDAAGAEAVVNRSEVGDAFDILFGTALQWNGNPNATLLVDGGVKSNIIGAVNMTVQNGNTVSGDYIYTFIVNGPVQIGTEIKLTDGAGFNYVGIEKLSNGKANRTGFIGAAQADAFNDTQNIYVFKREGGFWNFAVNDVNFFSGSIGGGSTVPVYPEMKLLNQQQIDVVTKV